MAYAFRVSDIDWTEPSKDDLPDEAVVILPNWLVEANSIDDDEWDEAINEQLHGQFGFTAESFDFEPVEEDG